MYEIQFDPQVCHDCETIDCLTRCQYMELDLAEAIKQRQAIINGEECQALHDCVTCYACQEYCPYKNNPFFLLVERQEQLGILPAPIPITKQQIKMMAPRGLITPAAVKAPVINLCNFEMLSGCIRPNLYEDVSVIGGSDLFCNIMWLHFAKNSVIRERVPQIIANIWDNYLKDSGVKELVCFHDECFGTYTSLAKAFGFEVPFKPIHYFTYIAQRLEELAETIKPLNAKIAYQRPCSSRLCPETEPVLDVIFQKIGAERVPRKYDRENALCCGGVIRAHQKDDLADEINEKNISDMINAKAQYCVFNCPFCMFTLGDEVARQGIAPILLTDLVQMAL